MEHWHEQETADSVAQHIAAQLADVHDALCDSSFTCAEAEALFEAFRFVGLAGLADSFMLAHAMQDDPNEDDEHTFTSSYVGGRYVRGWNRVMS